MITQLRILSLIKQCDLCTTAECHATRIALSLHGTYVWSKKKKQTKKMWECSMFGSMGSVKVGADM